jgi:hypothetical protein
VPSWVTRGSSDSAVACASRVQRRGLVLVRSIWRAEVELMSWEPRFEIAHRRIVPAAELMSYLWMEEGFEPIYHRTLVEAGLM